MQWVLNKYPLSGRKKVQKEQALILGCNLYPISQWNVDILLFNSFDFKHC